jgi:shikimate kinase
MTEDPKSKIRNLKSIFLIGFMGSGKTFLGRQLAQLLNYEFIDLDERIEEHEKKSIAEIFSEDGEAYFRAKESLQLQMFAGKTNAVIATGGGTPCFHDNMKWMNDHGFTVYLQLSPEILFQRLQPEITHRPLLAGKSDEEVKIFISTKLAERSVFYEQAKAVINTDSCSVQDIADLVRTAIH